MRLNHFFWTPLFFSLVLSTTLFSQTPCPTPPVCTAIISSTSITQIIVNTGDTICLDVSPTTAVEVIFNGAGTLIIEDGVTLNVEELNINTSDARIINFGTYQSDDLIDIPALLTVDNCGIMIGVAEITIEGKINNYPEGQIIIDNEIIAGTNGILRSEGIMCIVGLKGSTKSDNQNPMFFSFCYFKGIGNINIEEDLIVNGAFIIDGEVQTNNPIIIRSSGTFSELAFTGLWDLYGPARLFANILITAGEAKVQGQGEIQVNAGSELKIQLVVPEPPEPDCNPVLPVELISFEAQIISKNQVQLIWQTASEINNQGFELERSKNAIVWKKIGAVEGEGNSLEIIEYTFMDEFPMPINYYRLKQINFDGTFKYTPIIQAKLKEEVGKIIKLYPNPVVDKLMIDGLDQPFSTIQILNNNGRLVGVFNSSQPIDVSYLPSGMYTLIVKERIPYTIERFIKIDAY